MVCVVCDFLQESFAKLQDWIKELQHLGPPDIVLAIAGNKCDLTDKREVCWLFRDFVRESSSLLPRTMDVIIS